MRADTYFKKYLKPKLLLFTQNKKFYLLKDKYTSTSYTHLNLADFTDNKVQYFNLIRALLKIYPVIVVRDFLNIQNGIWVIGREWAKKNYIIILCSLIKAIERDLKDIKNTAIKNNKRKKLLNLIEGELTLILIKMPFTWEHEEFRTLAKTFQKSISTFRIKKSFYGK